MHIATEKLSRAIQIPTVSYSDLSRRDESAFRRWEAFLTEEFPLLHERLEKHTPGDLAILFRWEGSDGALLPGALLAHFDVVPPGEPARWKYPPFSGEIAEGCVWGRGAIDDKLSDITILQAVEELLAEGLVPERTIYLCFGGDEEIGGTEGARAIVRWLRSRGERLAWVIDEGGAVSEGVLSSLPGPAAMVGLAEKGHINVRLTARGAGGHASSPPKETAISRLARAIRRVVNTPFPRRITRTVNAFLSSLSPHVTGFEGVLFRLRPVTNPLLLLALRRNPRTRSMVESTQAVTMVSGGSAENVLPDSAWAVVNIRLLQGDSIESALEHIREAVDDPEVSVELHGEWGNNTAVKETPVDHPLLAIIERALSSVLPGTPVIPYLPTASTDSASYSALTANIFRFVPMLLDAEALSLIHNVDERVTVENVERCVGFYKEFLRSASRTESNSE